ncbi:MAG: hypothetical protein GY722_04280 [bacterium]|nr:hypothetical protein [bacterium]
MSENLWEELARSPLDPDPDYAPSLLEKAAPIGIAVFLGLMAGIFVLGGNERSDESGTTLAIETTTTTTAAPVEADPELPAEYLDIAGVGLRALAAYSRSGNLYIVINETTRSDQAPADTNAFHASDWLLSGDGIEIAATQAIRSHLAPGMTALEFTGVSELPVSGPSLLVRRSSEMVVRTGCQGCGAVSAHEASGDVPLDGLALPYASGEPILIDVGGAITLSVDHLEFTDEWGYVEWHITDENEGRIRADLWVVFEGTDDPASEDITPTQLIPDYLFGPSQQNPAAANPQPFARSGTLILDRVGEPLSEDNSPASLSLHWTVQWQHPVGEPILIPLDGTVDLGIVD